VLPELREVRIHSRRADSREQLAERLTRDLPGRDIHAVASWEDCIVGSDVVVEATRLTTPQPLLRTEWIAPGALVIPYGTVSAVDLNLTEIMDKIVVDDWGQAGVGPLGALRAHVDSGRLSEANLHAELGEIVASAKPGREHDGETILFWHGGLSITDIALGRALLARATSLNLGTRLPYRP
jgi:alanine dehydrogenase